MTAEGIALAPANLAPSDAAFLCLALQIREIRAGTTVPNNPLSAVRYHAQHRRAVGRQVRGVSLHLPESGFTDAPAGGQ
jgi:hypothetical protein